MGCTASDEREGDNFLPKTVQLKQLRRMIPNLKDLSIFNDLKNNSKIVEIKTPNDECRNNLI